MAVLEAGGLAVNLDSPAVSGPGRDALPHEFDRGSKGVEFTRIGQRDGDDADRVATI